MGVFLHSRCERRTRSMGYTHGPTLQDSVGGGVDRQLSGFDVWNHVEVAERFSTLGLPQLLVINDELFVVSPPAYHLFLASSLVGVQAKTRRCFARG